VQIVEVGVRGARKWSALEVGIHIVDDAPLPPHTFCRGETAGSNRDALKANLVRIRLIFVWRSNVTGRQSWLTGQTGGGQCTLILQRSIHGLQICPHHIHFPALFLQRIVLLLKLFGLCLEQFAKLLQLVFHSRRGRFWRCLRIGRRRRRLVICCLGCIRWLLGSG